MSSSSRSIREGRLGMQKVETGSDGHSARRRDGRDPLSARARAARGADVRGGVRGARWRAGYSACEIGFVGGFWLDYDAAPLLRRAARAARHRALGARPARRRSWATPTAARSSRWRSGCSTTPPGSRRRCGARARSSSTRASCSAASASRRSTDVVDQLGDLRERLEAKDRARPVRRRGDGPRARPRLDRRRARDRGARRLRPPGARLRAHARDVRRRVPRRSIAFADALARRGRGARARRAVPHPLLATSSTRTATRRSTCPTARGRCAPSRSRGARALRAAGDRDQRVAGRRRRRGRSRRSSCRRSARP